MRFFDDLQKDTSIRKRRFWALTTWAGASIVSGFFLGMLGFTRLNASSRGLLSELGTTLLYLFIGTQIILLGVIFYMYSLFEAQKMEPSQLKRFLDSYVQRLPAEDPRRQNVPSWKETRWRRLSPVIFIGQSLIILALLGWLSIEFQSNAYMQSWVQARLPLLRVALDPYFVALLAGVFLGATIIYFLQKRSRDERILEYLRKLE